MSQKVFVVITSIVGLYFHSWNSLTVHATDVEEYNSLNTPAREYCLVTESFEANCLKNEVIIMTSAVYGRMRIGRCLAAEGIDIVNAFGNDPRFIGCSVDVLHLMDKKCSGKNQCTVRGSHDSDFQLVTPCHVALKSYLEAGYECITVIEEDRSCLVSVSANPLHIIRSSASRLSCGSKSQPWMLEAPSGQQIVVNLLDFSSELQGETIQNSLRPNCQQYGYILDKTAKTNVSICGVQSERNKMIYKSQSNLIEIILIGSSVVERKEDKDILVGFRAVGCSDLVPPEDAWLRRSDNEATVGCYTSRQTWLLRCTDGHWTGVIGNCTREVPDDTRAEYQPTILTNGIESYQVMIVLVIAFLALAICLCVICTGAICLRRHYANSARKYCTKVEDTYRGIHSADSVKLRPELQQS